MTIQLIIFITKTKIFASEIKSEGKVETISINGNAEIKCKGEESVAELIECLFDAYNIDDFADDNFDIVIVESDADREIIKHLETKCSGATKLNIISMEKILPVIASAKNLIKAGQENVVTFVGQFYRISCSDSNIVIIAKTGNDEEAIALQEKDFAFLYHFIANVDADADKRKLTQANEKILALQNEVNRYVMELTELREIQKQFVSLQEEVKKQEEIKKQEEQKNQNNGTKQFCPNCGEMLKSGSNFCENCGFQVLENENANLMQVLKQQKCIFDSSSEYQGEFYISGSLPQNNIHSLLQKYSNMLQYIDLKNVFALYCPPKSNNDNAFKQSLLGAAFAAQTNIRKMCNLLFTEDGLFYDADSNGNYGFVYWSNIKSVSTERLTSDSIYNNNNNNNYPICIQLNDGSYIYVNGTPVFARDVNGNPVLNHVNLSNPFATALLAGIAPEERGVNERTRDFLAHFIMICHSLHRN